MMIRKMKLFCEKKKQIDKLLCYKYYYWDQVKTIGPIINILTALAHCLYQFVSAKLLSVF